MNAHVPRNLFVKFYPPMVVLHAGPLGGESVVRAQASRRESVPLEKRPQRVPSPLSPREDAVSRRPPVKQEVGPQRTPRLPAPQPGTRSLQACSK